MRAPRTCLRCGLPLPEGCSQSRKYCNECAKKHDAELKAKRQQRAAQMREARAEQRAADADREWCKPCAFCSQHFESHLCDYLIRTGHRRGCKAGEGCERRVL